MAIGLVQTAVLLANTTSLSGAVAFGDKVPVGIAVPAAFDGTSLTFQVSADGGTTWSEFYDASGAAVTITISTSRYIYLDRNVWAGVNNIKVRSGTVGSPAAQSADHTLTFVSRLF
jgi:hypothetical protein